MVCALGMGEALVGVSHECDFPHEVQGLPVLTSPRVAPTGSSRAIDADVRRIVKEALAVYEIDIEGLQQARPDIIVTQDLCEVCAVSFDDVCAAAKQLATPDLQIVNLHPKRLGDIWNDLRRIGQACSRDQVAEEVANRAQDRIRDLAARSTGRPRPNTLTIEWLDPVMVGGLWMPELIDLAGGLPLVTGPGQLAPTLNQEELRALEPAPDVVLIKPCGFTVDRTQQEKRVLESLFEALEWPAVSAGQIFIADGNAFFNRPGPRIVDSLEILAGCIHPTVFPELVEKHEGHVVPWTPPES
jgi:iron complex transport system substrate-binding protein